MIMIDIYAKWSGKIDEIMIEHMIMIGMMIA